MHVMETAPQPMAHDLFFFSEKITLCFVCTSGVRLRDSSEAKTTRLRLAANHQDDYMNCPSTDDITP
jgi:hypothetical protein